MTMTTTVRDEARDLVTRLIDEQIDLDETPQETDRRRLAAEWLLELIDRGEA